MDRLQVTEKFPHLWSVARALQGGKPVSQRSIVLSPQGRGLIFYTSCSVDAIRAERGLPELQTYVIDVVSGNQSSTTEESSEKAPTLLDSTETSDRVKEMKLGSTYIRKWLAEKGQPVKNEPTRKGDMISPLLGIQILLTTRPPLIIVQAAQTQKGNKDKPAMKTALSGKSSVSSKQGLSPTRTAYEASSQRIRWTYSEDALRDLRMSLNASAVQHCQENWQLEAVGLLSNVPFSSMFFRTYETIAAGDSLKALHTEVMLIMFYAASITTIIMGGGLSAGRPLPNTIEGVAITFLKRFYIRTSVLEWHPKVIM
jgi:hypothetical protein